MLLNQSCLKTSNMTGMLANWLILGYFLPQICHALKKASGNTNLP